MEKIVKIKMCANIQYELSNTGMIKANSMLQELFKNEHISKKVDNVIQSIENLLYDNLEVEKAFYDMLTNEVILHLREVKYLDENDEWFTTCEWCGGKLYENFRCSECGRETETK